MEKNLQAPEAEQGDYGPLVSPSNLGVPHERDGENNLEHRKYYVRSLLGVHDILAGYIVNFVRADVRSRTAEAEDECIYHGPDAADDDIGYDDGLENRAVLEKSIDNEGDADLDSAGDYKTDVARNGGIELGLGWTVPGLRIKGYHPIMHRYQ